MLQCTLVVGSGSGVNQLFRPRQNNIIKKEGSQDSRRYHTEGTLPPRSSERGWRLLQAVMFFCERFSLKAIGRHLNFRVCLKIVLIPCCDCLGLNWG